MKTKARVSKVPRIDIRFSDAANVDDVLEMEPYEKNNQPVIKFKQDDDEFNSLEQIYIIYGITTIPSPKEFMRMRIRSILHEAGEEL